jgi:hypothetical protein
MNIKNKFCMLAISFVSFLVAGCQSYQPTAAEVRATKMRGIDSQVMSAQSDCVKKLDAEPSIIITKQEILIDDLNASNKFELLTNKNKISDRQKVILSRAIALQQNCNSIAINGYRDIPILRVFYQTHYSSLDVIYSKLLTGESTIGAANQMKLEAMTKYHQDLVAANKIISDEFKTDYNNEIAARDRDRQARLAAYSAFVQQQQTQQLINQQNQNAIKQSIPTQTNCYRVGNNVSCTSY